MDAKDWLQVIVALLETFPALRDAFAKILSGDPAAQRVRDILAEESASGRAAEEIRRGIPKP